jgi:hypothetical protein
MIGVGWPRSVEYHDLTYEHLSISRFENLRTHPAIERRIRLTAAKL